VLTQDTPSQCAKTTLGGVVGGVALQVAGLIEHWSSPTAQPSPFPAPVPNVSTKTEVRLAFVTPVTWPEPPLHVLPPSVVCTIVESAPTIHPWVESLKYTPFRFWERVICGMECAVQTGTPPVIVSTKTVALFPTAHPAGVPLGAPGLLMNTPLRLFVVGWEKTPQLPD